MLTHERLIAMADGLVQVSGIVGVMLGGSRARDDLAPDSDYDLGLYYRPPLDVDALGQLAIDVAGLDARVTSPGDWGPWVDGGGWLTMAFTSGSGIRSAFPTSRMRARWPSASYSPIRPASWPISSAARRTTQQH